MCASSPDQARPPPPALTATPPFALALAPAPRPHISPYFPAGARFLFMAEYTTALKGKAEATLSTGESFVGGLGAGWGWGLA